MNTRHMNMKFTSEVEKDYLPVFLDIKVIRSDTTFITSVYRKPTFSGVYTNYNSFLPFIKQDLSVLSSSDYLQYVRAGS